MAAMDESSVCEMVMELAKLLASRPEDVKVSLIEGAPSSTVQIRAHRDDVDTLIGTGQRTQRAIKLLANASAAKFKGRFEIEIVGI
jgi:predicted RNA-binding protein YlqC (UPF0109 family)